MIIHYADGDVLGQIKQDGNVIGYIVTLPTFGIQLINTDVFISYIKRGYIKKLGYINGEIKALPEGDTDKFMGALPIFQKEDVDKIKYGYIVGTVSHILGFGNVKITSMVFIGTRPAMERIKCISDNDGKWLMSDTLDSIVVAEPIEMIASKLSKSGAVDERMLIDADSFIENNKNDYFRLDNEVALKRLGYNVSIKALNYTQMKAISTTLKNLTQRGIRVD